MTRFVGITVQAMEDKLHLYVVRAVDSPLQRLVRRQIEGPTNRANWSAWEQLETYGRLRRSA